MSASRSEKAEGAPPRGGVKPKSKTAGNVVSADPVWDQVLREAHAAMAAEPALTGFIFATVVNHSRLEDAIAHRVAQRLNHSDVDASLILQTFQEVTQAEPQ